METKLEITHELEKLAEEDKLDSKIAILNLPTANYCEKRAERVLNEQGELEQSCLGCIHNELKSTSRLSKDRIEEVIDYFAKNHGTKFITINGRGDPFFPTLKPETVHKVQYAYQNYNIQSYIFTAGDNLDEQTCRILAESDANITISLFGNKFIDADFFAGKEYASAEKPLQNQANIAENLRRLISTYRASPNQPKEGTTRLGMNYVVSESDLQDDGRKVSALKQVANENGLFFVCNTPFEKNSDSAIQQRLETLAHQHSDFNLQHSTAVKGQCQMGAGSSATVDYDGTMLRCPYMDNKDGNGKFQELSQEEREQILEKYVQDRAYLCVMRKHQK